MLYIFDLGNVIVDIDFNRVMGVWSDFSRIPLARLQRDFIPGEAFYQHERGELSDHAFAEALCHDLNMPLSYEQFAAGWQAVFVSLRPEVIAIMARLREQGHRVIVLSNTNNLHTAHWPELYPEVYATADAVYLSHELGTRKPEPDIFLKVLDAEGVRPQDAVFFDDNEDNIRGAQAVGITSVLVIDKTDITDYFA